jgi:LysM repeat protein
MLFGFTLALSVFGSSTAFAGSTTPYTLQEGDNFWTLSQKYNVPYHEVLAANPDKDPLNLYLGLK